MNRISFFIFLLISILFLSCGSVSNYSRNNLDKNYFAGKEIYFVIKQSSAKYVNMSGLYIETIFDDYREPIVSDVFGESLQELALETNIRLRLVYNEDNFSSNAIIVNVEINEILWHFSFSKATMKTKMKYEIADSNKTYDIEGIHKSIGSSKAKDLKKSFKNANYKILKELQK